MKTQLMVSVCVGSALLAGAEPETPAAVRGDSVPEQAVDRDRLVVEALQKYNAALERVVPMLAGIKDKPTAELHAFDVGNLFIEYENMHAEFAGASVGLSEADLLRLAPDALRRNKFLSKRFRVQCRRLSWAGHYDCLDLRAAMGEEVQDHETEPEKERPLLPEEQVQQLAAAVEKARALYLSRHSNVQGGPGFTRETAWIMLDTKMSVIAQEYEIMKQVIRQSSDRQSLVYEGDRWYDLLEYDIKVDGVTYTVDQWFDITLHADTMSARAQAAAQQVAAEGEAAAPAEGGVQTATPQPVPPTPSRKVKRSRSSEDATAPPSTPAPVESARTEPTAPPAPAAGGEPAENAAH